MNVRRAVVAAVLAAGVPLVVQASGGDYFPQVPASRPAGVVTGVLTEFGIGNESGGFTIRTAAGKSVDLYVANPPFKIDGRAIDCPMPPQGADSKRDPDVCSRWPEYVVIGRTWVRVPYWRGSRFGAPTLFSNAMTTRRR